MGSESINAGSHRVVLPQYGGPSEETTSMLETAVKDVDLSSYHDDTIFTSLPGEAFGKNNSEVQEQSAVLEAAESNKEESHLDSLVDKGREILETYDNGSDHFPEDTTSKRKALMDEKTALKMVEDKDGEISERHDGDTEQKGYRDVTIAGDQSIPNFPGDETGHGDVFKLSRGSISQETLEKTSNFKSVTFETVSNPVPVTDVDNLEENGLVGDRITDTIDIPDLGGEDPVLEKSQGYTSGLREIATDMEAKVAVEEDANEMSNGAEDAHDNRSTLMTAHSDIIEEIQNNGNTDTSSEIDRLVVESHTSDFPLNSNYDLRNLEGKPSSISTHNQSPVKFTTEGRIDQRILMAMKDTTSESTPGSAEIDNVPALTHAQSQVSSITDQDPLNDNDRQDDGLPYLSKAEPPNPSIQRREQEIPDSDAITESSQQSPQKLGRIEKQVDRGMSNIQIAQIPITDGATEGDNENEETEDLVSSFGRECATSSIDPKKQPNEPKSMEAETLQNISDNATGEFEASIMVGLVDSAQKVMEDSRANIKDDIEARSSSAQHSPQKMANKGRQPSRRKISGIVINKIDDEEPIEKKTTSIESDLDEPMRMDTKDSSNTGSPVLEKKKRGRPSGRKISALPVEESATKQGEVVSSASESHGVTDIDKTIEPTTKTPGKEPLANELSTSSPEPEKRKPGRPVGRKISTLSKVTDDVDTDNSRRETAPMDEVSTYSIIDSKSTDGPDESSLVHSRQEKKRRGRPPGRKSSNLNPEKTDFDEVLYVPNGVTKTAPSEESTINDPAEDTITNSSSPIKRRRGRPSNQKPSESSPKEADTEEVDKEAFGNFLAMAPKDVEIEEATVDHKSTMEPFIISSSPVKKKRGEDLHSKLRLFYPMKQKLGNCTRRLHQHRKMISSERPRKRGRPSNRKASELKFQAMAVEAVAEEMSEDNTTEKTANTILSDLGDFQSTNELADADSSPVKRKRGRPTSRAASELNPKKTIVNGALKETRDMTTRNSAGSGIIEPVADLKSADESPLSASSLPEMTKKEEEAQGMMAQNSIATLKNEPLVVNPSPKRKRGRPASRKPSGTSLERQDIVAPVKEILSDATKVVSETLVNADINDSDASLSATSSPEKRRRGRPARKASSLNIESATNERILAGTDVDAAGKNMPTEIVDSDEERDELQEESPPPKKASEEHLSELERNTTTDNEKVTVDIEAHKELISSEKKRCGRPSAAKARRISISESEVMEEEKQIPEKIKFSDAENEEPVEVDDEQEEPIIEKKKRGRPALPKSKGEQTEKISEPADEEHVAVKNAISTIGSSKESLVPNSSSSSFSSQRQDAFFAEMKAMKISSIQTRSAQLRSEITQKREKVLEISQGLEQPARETVKKHIKLLHDYNDIKDVGQGLLDLIAQNRGVRAGELYEEFGVATTD
ncbi:hypothetical protein EYC84_008048 [Monilinia fructicola]|uniref:DNA repair protein Swi5/Sae3 n=1 Tax=Monilinia fructicola TaxID=38448 RepID=A0A5M9JGW9_MONFR|nr:hypothetical protein EYC84_008048 [Monilinia fructicola]